MKILYGNLICRNLHKTDFSFGDRLQNDDFMRRFDLKIVVFGFLQRFLL
ncbi:hypothetical protein LEP1GSC068_2305 [Leptospira sp. Fiocruz LV3954]|nr:hypothetical protein LEP1GSC068_2305 [Leptospira sp. Fiocruz LV3954]EMI66591.1 hypothetical protein LEP1GSC076_0315 [Leptospira sp. Fiocruz LV4135]